MSIGDLAKADPKMLRELLGDKMSAQARRYANGLDDSPVRKEPDEAKGYSNSVTLEENVTTLEQADAILLALCDSVSAHMRSEGAKAGLVSVAVRYLDFSNRSHQMRLERPTDTTNEVYEISRRLLRELWKDKRPLRLLSVSLTNLSRAGEGEQLTLFGEEDDAEAEKQAKIDRAVDALRSKFGADIIQRGTVMGSGLHVARKYKGRQEAEQDEK